MELWVLRFKGMPDCGTSSHVNINHFQTRLFTQVSRVFRGPLPGPRCCRPVSTPTAPESLKEGIQPNVGRSTILQIRMNRPELKALIFDVDGTLADNERDGHRRAFNLAFREAGLDWHWDVETYDRLLDVFGGKERLRHYIGTSQPDFEPAAGLDAFIRDLHARKTWHYLQLLKAGRIPLRPGVARLLREARAAQLALAVASTTTLENVTTLLRETLGEESIAWFDVISAGDVVKNKKPAPDIFLHALGQLGLEASDCLVIEDTEAGLAAARAAGLATVITVNGATRHQDFTGAGLVVDQLGEPGQPFEVLAGDAGASEIVDVALLRRIHARLCGS